MNIGFRQSMWNEKMPFDYRVQYFEVATTYPCFECGPFTQYNPTWTLDPNYNIQGSPFQIELLNNFYWECIFTFPNSLATDQKICGNNNTFCVYPYSNRYNIGGFSSWLTNPTTAQAASVSSTNTLTKASAKSIGNNTLQGTIIQGSNTIQWNILESSNNKFFNLTRPNPILLYAESESYQVMRVYVGTRFYENQIYFNMSGANKAQLRFVPCIKNNQPYICEMNTKTMIPNSMSGTVIAGPEVPNNYYVWNENN